MPLELRTIVAAGGSEPSVTATPTHLEIEEAFVALCTRADLGEPDGIEYLKDSVVFYFDEPRVAVAVDFDDVP